MTDTPSPDWTDYDHLKMAAMEDPVPYLEALRARCPIGRSDQHGGFYILTKYADCVKGARDMRLSSALENGPGPGFPFDHNGLLRQPMITDDDPRHRDFRMPLQRIFTPKMARGLEGEIRRICDDLIDQFIETGEGDLADQFSIELPAVLISDLLNLPQERRREFQGWAASFVATMDMDAARKMTDYTAELYDLRCAAPGSDVPSQMLDFEIDGRPITRDEWRGLVMLVILGGLDTTANAGGYIFNMIGRDPALRRYLLDDPSRIPGSINEFVRLVSPVPQHSRGVTDDIEIGGHRFRKGDVVQLNWLAANHDPEAFPEPDVFKADRKVSHHVGFGHGPHLCLGRHLAIVELEVMIERVLARLPDYQLVEGGTERFPSLNRGMSHMRVTFTPGPKITAAGEGIEQRHAHS